jgi:hypothetical protein
VLSVIDDGTSENPLHALLPGHDRVAYHGTPSVYTASIEANGLSHEFPPFSPQECDKVIAAFERVDWRDAEWLGTLYYWGTRPDITRSGHRHIYLAETCARASTWAHMPGARSSGRPRRDDSDLLCHEGLDSERENRHRELTTDLR